MKIVDNRPEDEGRWAVLSSDGIHLNRNGLDLDNGQIVQEREHQDAYLLCLEAASNPWRNTSGSMRWFLVSLTDGRRAAFGREYKIRPIKAELHLLD